MTHASPDMRFIIVVKASHTEIVLIFAFLQKKPMTLFDLHQYDLLCFGTRCFAIFLPRSNGENLLKRTMFTRRPAGAVQEVNIMAQGLGPSSSLKMAKLMTPYESSLRFFRSHEELGHTTLLGRERSPKMHSTVTVALTSPNLLELPTRSRSQ